MGPLAGVNLEEIAYQAMLDRGFYVDFSPQAMEEMSKLEASLPENIDACDMRDKLWCSIDNETSRDLDQLTYAERLSGGGYKAYIAVSDVVYFISRDSFIDRRAAHNTISVYTPAVTFPMLPLRLSTDLSSLNPHEDRLSIVFEATLSDDGELQKFDVYKALVNNHAKLSYNGVSSWLDDTTSMLPHIDSVPGMAEQLLLQDELADKLDRVRHQHGALTLELIATNVVLSNGVPVAIKKQMKNRARTMTENFMILANTISAQYADENQMFSLRRVVKTPQRWDKVVSIAKSRGVDLPNTPDVMALEQFLVSQKEKDPETFPDLSIAIVKLLGKGEYSVAVPGQQPSGHFALAVHDYSHATAPSRRFIDIVTHRLLIASLEKRPSPYTESELQTIASYCTQKENDAEKIERQMKKAAAAIVLASSVGKIFDAMVTGASEKGTWVRVAIYGIEGRLASGLCGVDVGDNISVELVSAEPEKGFIDFSKASSCVN